MFDEITFNQRRDDTHPAPRANGVYHLPPDFTDAQALAAADWVAEMARAPRVCPPEEIEALFDRLQEALGRERAAQEAAEALLWTLPPELCGVAGHAAQIAIGYPEAEGCARRLLDDASVIELEFVRLVPTTIRTLKIFSWLAEENDGHVDGRGVHFVDRLNDGLKILGLVVENDDAGRYFWAKFQRLHRDGYDGLSMESADLLIVHGREFGPCLLWAATDSQAPRWLVGWWNGVEWAAEGCVIAPLEWYPLPRCVAGKAAPADSAFDENTLADSDLLAAERKIAALRAKSDAFAAAGNAGADDPVVALWAERNRLDAIAIEADAAHDEARVDEIDTRMMAIEQTMCRTLATTLPGVLVQMDFLAMMRKSLVPDDDDEFLSVNIRAAIVALIEREGQCRK